MSSPHDIASLQGSADSETHRVKDATTLLQRLNWLAPLRKLAVTNGSAFGRQIEQNLRDIKDQSGIISIKLRHQPAAVVMSIEHYEELLQMKEACALLIKAQRRQELETLGNEFDRLYQLMQRPEHRVATEALFGASVDDLNATYRPGKTETDE